MAKNSDENNKKEEFLNYFKKLNEYYKLFVKILDQSITKEEREKILRELIPIHKELKIKDNERIARGEKQFTPKMILEDLKRKGIVNLKMPYNEIVIKLKDDSLTKEERRLYSNQLFYTIAEQTEKIRKYKKKKGKKKVGKPPIPDLSQIGDILSRTRTIISSRKINLNEKDDLELQCPNCNVPLTLIPYDEKIGKLICRKCGYEKITKNPTFLT